MNERVERPTLRALGASFLGLVRSRIELAVVELQEVGERKKGLLTLAVVAGVFLSLGALLFAMFVVVLFWDTHRVVAAGIVTAVYLAIGAFALMRLKQRAAEMPPPFAATLEELKRDVAALGGKNE